jgi:putative phosphoribosyl transferase
MLRPSRVVVQRGIIWVMFVDRRDAGTQLGELLRGRIEPPVVVLAIPRGGVVVAAPVAEALGGVLDLVVPKKLGAPGNPELGIGAIAPDVRVLDDDVIAALRVPATWIEAETVRVAAEVRRRTQVYRKALAPATIAGSTVIVVDDGVATGSTARAAGAWARANGATRVVLAVPVAPVGVEWRLGGAFDDVIAVLTPSSFRAVGQWYEDFEQVTDEEVRAVLESRTA